MNIGLSDVERIFFFGRQKHDFFLHLYFAILYLPVGCFDEAHFVHLRVNTERRNQTDVWTFGRFNRAQATIVGIMNVAYFKTGTLTGKTTRTECRHPTLVRNLCQRVGLVHELRKLVRSKKRIDHGRQGARVDQINGLEIFVVANIHSFFDGAGHPCQPHAKLRVELLTHGPHPSVAQVVNIIHYGFGVDQADQVFYDKNNILGGQHALIGVDIQSQFFIDAVTSHFAQIIAFFTEEQALNNITGGLFIRRFGISQLTVDLFHRFLLGIGIVLGECVENNMVIGYIHIVAVQNDRFRT